MRTSRRGCASPVVPIFFIINTLEGQDLNFNADKPQRLRLACRSDFFYYKHTRRTGFEL